MKKLCLAAMALFVQMATVVGQAPFTPQYNEKEVFKNEDVIFRQIDAHTWVGSGHLMANESLYLIEGDERAILIDAGTKIADLDKIVAKITYKPVTLMATHVHPDHTGEPVNYFPEIYINAGDMVNVAQMMGDYKGEIKYLRDGEVIDLGGRQIEVIFTPGHTPGSTTFFDKAAGYGFSGDAFGSGNLLLGTNFSTLLITCQRTGEYMQKNNIRHLYPGHYMGSNLETPKRVSDMLQMSKDMLAGKLKGEKNDRGMMGLNHVLNMHGVRINYGESQLK
ncbi:hydroxyacylglutathione hydrolase [Parabacteroides sp. PFB2-12]|uniref:MBL fold metallo-hydrolase n=1 Tax=unclassified Parabacteroides TaxID=2649774 RepID=UPI0024742F8E|nr:MULTISPECIES: MBL fold metallo-hydrolase [unclassified Parabacteroides]MDH6343506.1 hydroxyacylglutathione hydrolase [Parabacteroides sp. PM6-13]MDH6390894.1 hydroxyacylglutathione hydrolase [Parabacteroides sp. PFB2-12]